jgi:hypothetical protein
VAKRGAGLTRHQVLIVLCVAAVVLILTAIPIREFLRAQRAVRETRLDSTLEELRFAIARFHSDCGVHPRRLADLMARTPPAYVDARDFAGPYMMTVDGQLPRDPITRRADWKHDPSMGEVRSSAAGKTIDGAPYSEL